MQTKIQLSQQIEEIVQFIGQYIHEKPEFGLILGSGLGALADKIKDPVVIPYHEIPYLPTSTAPGHAGNLILGKIGGRSCITMQGRLHLYEGYTPQTATILIRAMKKLGVEKLIITCAAGGLNSSFHTGDIMLLTDHINFSGQNPLLGQNLAEFGPRFPIMFDVYTPVLRDIAIEVANQLNTKLVQGVYVGILGPTYATRAELQMYIASKCDAIGMSVVQEATAAAHAGMKVLGFAAITDMALPYLNEHSNEEQVIESGKNIAKRFKILVEEVIKKI